MRMLRCLLLAVLLGGCVPVLGAEPAPLWEIGRADDSSAEFGDYRAHDGAFTPQVKAAEFPRGMRGNVNPRLSIAFDLPAVPEHGVTFSFKLLHGPRSGAQMAVFSNELLAGLIQLWGTDQTGSPHRWLKTYRLYIPPTLLKRGANELRLETARPLWSDAAVDPVIWWEWDYLALQQLSAPAGEPIHGALVFMGTTLKHSANDFYVNDDTLAYAPPALKWLGIAYSGNTIRADFWQNVGHMQPRRKEYLSLLADLHMSVIADYVSMSHYQLDLATGELPVKTRDEITRFFADLGPYFQYYELGNEPCMFGGGFTETVALARFVNSIRPAHVKLTAPGWAYGGGLGTPKNWDASVLLRQRVEEFCQATNGHSYGFSYADHRGGSFVENLATFGGVTDGWPMEFVNTETGANDWHSEDNGPRLKSSQPHASAFDRCMRAHIAVTDRFMQHAAIFEDFGIFQPSKNLKDPNTLVAFPGVKGEDNRLKTYRRLALAYATHGTPLPWTLVNAEALKNQKVYVRCVDTQGTGPLPGNGRVSNRILLNFVNFENTPQSVKAKIRLPKAGEYGAERFGPGNTYAEAHSILTLNANPEVELDVQLGGGDSVQYLLVPPGPSPEGSIPVAGKPAGPMDLKAVVGDGVVTLSWTPVAGRGYRIERADGWKNDFKRIGDRVDAGRYIDKGLANGRAYRYRLVADRAVPAEVTEPVVAFPEAALPAVVMGGVIAGDGRVVLSWEPAPDAITYSVFRSDSADGNFKPVGLPVASQEFVDDSAVNGKAFYYKVAPQRRGPLGPLSAGVSAKPDAAPLGAEWHSADIGSVGKRGSASLHPQSGVVTVSGSGDNVWGKKDSLQYVWQKLSGKGTITVHVLNFDNTSDFALSGVMVRESLKVDSAMALLAVTPGKGCGLVHRPANGSECVWAGGAGHPWLRLIRDGGNITAMVSKDGAKWTVHAKATVALPDEVMIGLAVSSHHNGRLDKVLYDNVKVEPGK